MTKPLDMAKDDLAYLRSIPQRPASAEIFGSVEEVYPPPHDMVIPLVRVGSPLSVSVAGPGIFEIKTNRSGQYKLTDLAPGRYTIRLNTDTPTESDHVQTVDVAPRGCAEINFYIVKPFPPKTSEKKR